MRASRHLERMRRRVVARDLDHMAERGGDGDRVSGGRVKQRGPSGRRRRRHGVGGTRVKVTTSTTNTTTAAATDTTTTTRERCGERASVSERRETQQQQRRRSVGADFRSLSGPYRRLRLPSCCVPASCERRCPAPRDSSPAPWCAPSAAQPAVVRDQYLAAATTTPRRFADCGARAEAGHERASGRRGSVK